uniref:WD repeat-containing protein 76 n=1 Tax=Xiphophorus couchianus TaxID=32473 RepID=A0A3B5M5C2_9TELE
MTVMSEHRYISALKNLKIREDDVVKVVKDRVFSAAFHPCSSSLLLAAGDKWGKVGLWNMGAEWGDDGVLLFEPHSRPVGSMAFSRCHPNQLLSASYDGSLRCMDVEKAVFDDVYDINDGLKTFAFMSHDCFTVHNKCICSFIYVHPLQMQYFVAAESRTVSIYDSRYLKKTQSKAVSHLNGHALSITSAYFSPCTGNRVLTSCLDNHIRIYDTSSLTTEPPLITSIRYTGRWLSKLSAVWDPKQEDCFVVGSMKRPRRVEVFHESGQLLHSFLDENLGTVLSVTAFHPTRNALLGGNSSGRMHVFHSWSEGQ